MVVQEGLLVNLEQVAAVVLGVRIQMVPVPVVSEATVAPVL